MNAKNSESQVSMYFSYGVGGLGEGIGYNFFFGFFLFFLTNVAGVHPAWAGTIAMVAVLWDAISDPLIGYLSDNSKNPKGRRRPFMFKGSILLGVALFLLFTNLNISPALKIIYYIVVNILYWLGLTSCVIPHTSLGAELTDDFNERTSIRAYQTFFMNIGAGAALSGTLMIVAFFSRFVSDSAAWTMTGAFFGAIVFLAYFICYWRMRGKEKPNINLAPKNNEKADRSIKSFLTTYGNVLRNKPLRYILALDFALNFVLGISVSIRIYLYTYAFSFDEATISTLLLLYSIVIIVGVWGASKLASALGKKTTMIAGGIIYALGFLLVYFSPTSVSIAGAGLVLEGLGNCTFWTLLYSFAYDTVIVEKYKHGEGNEGVIVSLIGLMMKAGNAIGMWLCGLGLAYIGFNAELLSQSATTNSGLKFLYGVVSALVLLIGIGVFSRYPLNEAKYNKIKNAVDKSDDKIESIDGFEFIL